MTMPPCLHLNFRTTAGVMYSIEGSKLFLEITILYEQKNLRTCSYFSCTGPTFCKATTVYHGPTRNMPVDAHKISFGYKHSLTNCYHLNFFTSKKCESNLIFWKLGMPKFSGHKMHLQKCFSKKKKLLYIQIVYFIVFFTRFNHKIVFWGEN